MNENMMLGKVMVFKGDEDYYTDDAAGVELVEVSADGTAEICFYMSNKLRVYVSVRVSDLMGRITTFGREAK